jgi:DNA-binding NtrC family response regulator
MQYAVWYASQASAPMDINAIGAALEARGIALTRARPVDRAPDAIVAPWSARASMLAQLAAPEWGEWPPPAQVYLADVSLLDAVCPHMSDFLTDIVLMPCRPEDLVLAIHRGLQRREHYLNPPVAWAAPEPVEDGLIGTSEQLRKTIETAYQVAVSPATSVLIEGESGTGKELIARLIHTRAPGRRHRAFIDVNCAAIPSELLEAELFGFERGAFTQAARDKAGLMELAHGGTLFLDEIAELNISLQAKLLRALETQTFRRLGGVTARRSDCRIVASTNRSLLDAVQRGLFRLDLYHRLAVMTIHVPPLRERREDIMPLAEHFLHTFARVMNRRVTAFSAATRALLEAYPYQGNVRELRNIIERALIVETGALVTPKSLGLEVTMLADVLPSPGTIPSSADRLLSPAIRTLDQEERRHIEDALNRTRGNRSLAARLLGISVPTLYNKIRKYGFEHVGRY